MLRSEFSYHLPEELIAQFPVKERSASRLLHVIEDSRCFEDLRFIQLPTLLRGGDLLVFNNTKVIAARLRARKSTGGRVEILIERLLDANNAIAHLRASKSPKAGGLLILEDDKTTVTVIGRQNELFHIQLQDPFTFDDVLQRLGHIPLPPYIQRIDDDNDVSRYQTVYATHQGAVAAPTAGLHFDDGMLARLKAMHIDFAFVTLHVGSGTFQPVRSEHIENHSMHSEVMCLDENVCDAVRATRARGGRVVAVGTTSVRCLESAARDGELQPFQGETDIFIYPGYRFNVVDAMITNFHLPESTLLMLVCAFAGKEVMLNAYRHAVEQRYRFFSYGDAMFISKTAAL